MYGFLTVELFFCLYYFGAPKGCVSSSVYSQYPHNIYIIILLCIITNVLFLFYITINKSFGINKQNYYFVIQSYYNFMRLQHARIKFDGGYYLIIIR